MYKMFKSTKWLTFLGRGVVNSLTSINQSINSFGNIKAAQYDRYQ